MVSLDDAILGNLRNAPAEVGEEADTRVMAVINYLEETTQQWRRLLSGTDTPVYGCLDRLVGSIDFLMSRSGYRLLRSRRGQTR